MGYALEFTDEFRGNIDFITGYMRAELDNPSAAERFAKKVRKVVRNIKAEPFLYPLYHDEKLSSEGYRYAVISNYLLFYHVDEKNKVIHISHLLYGRQDISEKM